VAGTQNRGHSPDADRSIRGGPEVYDWVDRKAQDALAPAPGNQRELLVWVWYPAQADAVLDDYLPLSCERRRVQIAGR